MLTGSIQTNEIFQFLFQLVLIIGIFRFIFLLGILYALIAAKVVLSNRFHSSDNPDNRISPCGATDVIFFHFFWGKIKPFWQKKVYLQKT